MPVEGVYSVEEQRALVYAYLQAPQGTKARLLAEWGVSRGRMRTWRSMVFADTLEYGLAPRDGYVMSKAEKSVAKRLMAENEALRAQLAAREEELAVQQRAVDALGKAIEILHQSGAIKSSSNERAQVLNEPGQPGQPAQPGKPGMKE